LGRWEQALKHYDDAIAADPHLASAHNNRGNALAALGLDVEAKAAFKEALKLRSSFPEANNNLGKAFFEAGQFEQAASYFKTAVANKRNYAEAYLNLALLFLLKGDWLNGTALYEWRWKTTGMNPHRQMSVPQLNGNAQLNGKRVLVHAEQGFGDSIQFCRYTKLLQKLGAHVVLEVQAPLLRLLATVDGASEVIQRGQVMGPIDFQIPMLSVPLAMGSDLGSIPAQVPYVSVSEHNVANWATRLMDLTGCRVGLAWRGSKDHTNDHNRSLSLHEMLKIKKPGISFVSLQYEVSDVDELALVKAEMFDPSGQLNDFADTAALIECLDLVISVDTSVAHLAGALGKPTWVLLPFVPDWRWMLEREDSPWYPTMKLYRQPKRGDWDSVLERVRADLATHFGTSGTPTG